MGKSKVWSFSTTMRNPERIVTFLKALNELDGIDFDENAQEQCHINLIKNGDYIVTDRPTHLQNIYTRDEDITDKEARELFDFCGHDAKRGRTFVAPLNARGLSIARKSLGKVVITDLGKKILLGHIDNEEFFTRSLLKWQLPNPLEKATFSGSDFNICPFPAVLKLIDCVNNLYEKKGNVPVGLSKDEFTIFVPTLRDYENIEKQAAEILNFREEYKSSDSDNKKAVYKKWAKKKLDECDAKIQVKSLSDYCDSCIRNFRMTSLISIRGNGRYVDLNKEREIEILSILENDSLLIPKEFDTVNEYMSYLGDVTVELPWAEKYASIISHRYNILKHIKTDVFDLPEIKENDVNTNKSLLNKINIEISRLQDSIVHGESQNINTFKDCIDSLNTIHSAENRSVELERLSALGLYAMNDALMVSPNYPKDNDGRPTSHAPAGKPDIEAFYKAYNLICEVTMLKGRDQWYNEGQPVMRHLRDFEKQHKDKHTYCLFIAPRLHEDTIETFWTSSKYGYRGAKQKIVPLTIKQYIEVLGIVSDHRYTEGKDFTYKDLQTLFDLIMNSQKDFDISDKWIADIPSQIGEWKKCLAS